MDKKVHKTKNEINGEKLKISQCKLTLNNKSDETKKLESKIVHNPEKFKQQLSDLEGQSKLKDYALNILGNKLKLFDNREMSTDKFQKSLDVALCQTCMIISKSRNKFGTTNQEIILITNKRNDATKVYKKTDENDKKRNKQVNALKKEYNIIRSKASEVKKNCDKTKSEMRDKMTKFENKSKSMGHEVLKIDQQIMNHNKLINETNQNQSNYINNINEQYNVLLIQINKYNISIQNNLTQQIA